jgi:hypothetical protein
MADSRREKQAIIGIKINGMHHKIAREKFAAGASRTLGLSIDTRSSYRLTIRGGLLEAW